MVIGFEVGAVPFNPDGWGPPDATVTPTTTSTLPLNVPYAPFSRSESSAESLISQRNLYPGSGQGGGGGGRKALHPTLSSSFTADDSFPSANDNDSSFRLVDGKPPPRPKFVPKWRFNQHHRSQLPQRRDEEVEAKKREAEKERARRDRLYFLNRSNQNQQRREAAVFKSSVEIQPEWNMLDQIPFSTFTKLSFSVPEPEDMILCGGLESYDKSFDRITPKAERRLERFKNRNFFKVTTTDDPVIRRLASEDKATVFATDNILATLMCATRSVYSWDIVVQRNFSQQVLFRDGNKVSFDEPNPFANEGEEVASVAYRYRRWKLDDDTCLVARCEVQSVVEVNKQRSFLTLNALNEFDPKYSGVDWSRNMMKLGYVSRVHPRDHFNHVILAVVGYKPRDFASQINLNTSNMWGIVKSIVDLCMKLNEGKYVLVKDPSKPQVRIYEVPADAFENDYVEEPLPEDEQVQPPEENAENTEANGVANDVEDKEIGAQA
uniref:Eukaryotic translation initiation factor 3 subunit 7 n=1 Tax=Salix viminalis TaxID=40686 RepID=A0A6N2KEW7_SALVM